MIRQLLNIAWGVAIGIMLIGFTLALGSTLEDLTLEFTVTAVAAGTFVLIGAVVVEIENRAFKRGQLDAEEKLRELQKDPR